MNHRVRKHHRATLRRIQELQQELDVAIRATRELAESDPGGDAFLAALSAIELIERQLQSQRALAMTLNRMLPDLDVRLVPPTPERYPTPRPHRHRGWARVRQMPIARTRRDTPT